ncbi:DUF6461 domain-containing protein [Streptomyces sp. NPDC088354]|uniref:DUF6461 domain-containing protein n=1 Tax=Streptomyces sp. NPDC088354 TaxID=3365856 RepID=UPI00382B2831
MSIGWLLEPYVVDCVTFARHVEPAALASRLGASPRPDVSWGSAQDAADMLADPEILAVARVGRLGDWSFAVEYGDAAGPTEWGLRAASGGGGEAVNFLLTPWHPPSMFAYYSDGVHMCSFGIGEEGWRWGTAPDLLVPDLNRAGVLPVGPQRDPRGARLSMSVITAHFGLRLPRRDIVDGGLPLYVRSRLR